MSRIVRRVVRRRPALQVRLPERRWQRVLVAGLAVAIIGAAVLAVTGGDSPGREAEATVRDFFEARADGDCVRLSELVSERSRARIGLDDRSDFVASCDEVVDGFAPPLTAARSITTGDDRAVVAVEVADPVGGRLVQVENDPDADDEATGSTTEAVHATAVLVREGGDWKVETDLDLLRIGASPAETLRLYYEAWLAGECDLMANVLSPDGWTAAHADDRDDYVEQCEASNQLSVRPETDPPIPRFELQEQDQQLTAVGEAPNLVGELPETITMVADGLRWRLDHDTRIVGQWGMQRLTIERPAGYEPHDEPVFVGPEGADQATDIDDVEGTNGDEQRFGSGLRWGMINVFPMVAAADRQVTVAIYEFGTTDGAGRYADGLVDHIAGTATGGAALDPSTAATDVRPYVAVTVCDSNCDRRAYRAVGIDVHDRYLAVVVQDDDAYEPVEPAPTSQEIRAHTAAVLQSQIDVLP